MEHTTATRVYNEYKTRNILSLADRVQVIREYDSHLKKPSFQRLATKFDCSSKQIKNIILSRDSILKSYQEGDENDHEDPYDQALHKRQEKIDFLGKVIYEYIQRILYFNYPIDEDKVREKALQIKECIAIENFQPSNGWFKNFKMTYGIPDFNPETLRNNIRLTEAKRPHLSAIDMIQFVSRQEQKAQKLDVNGNQRKRGRPSHIEKLQQQNHNLLEPTIVYETIDDDDDDDDDGEVIHNNNQRRNNDADSDDDDDVQIVAPYGHNNNNKNTNNSYQSNKHSLLSSSSSPPPLKRLRSNSPLPDIGSPEDALKHVKCLEEYAMLQDNFRAIGLLTQLEQIFKKKHKQS